MKLLFVYSLICLALISCKRENCDNGAISPFKIEGPTEGNIDTPIKFIIHYQFGTNEKISEIDLIENDFEKTLILYKVNLNCAGGTTMTFDQTYEHTFVFKKPGTYYLHFPKGFGRDNYSQENDLIETLTIYP